MTQPFKTPEEARAFLARLGLLDTHRRVEGTERVHLELLLAMMEPDEESNNQHSWSYRYVIGERVYNVTYFPGADEPIIEEHIKYQDEQ